MWEEENLARKVEGDWNMVYLARREGVTAKGTVTWKIQVCQHAKFSISSPNFMLVTMLIVHYRSEKPGGYKEMSSILADQ